jgi:predicted glutamine amidotransferase
MCRLFGLLSVEASDARKYLLEDPCSLYTQSRKDPRRLQGDGWGIGYYENGSAVVVKSEKPVYMEHERFVSAIDHARSKIILAHIRRASNPRGLPRERIISMENSQPFTFEKYIFAHNGTITIPDEVAECLEDWRQRIRGLNDSEVYFWFIMKEVSQGADVASALKRFKSTLEALWRDVRKRYLEKSRPYVGLNSIISDGENLCAYCGYDEKDRRGRSICFGDQPVFEMCYLLDEERLVVTSEKTNLEEDWKPLRTGELLIGRTVGQKVRVEILKIG